MTEDNPREELIGVIDAFMRSTDDLWIDGQLADAILAAGWRKPRVVETVEELSALPNGALIRDANGEVAEHRIGAGWEYWVLLASEEAYTSSMFRFPPTVIWTPEENA